MSVAALVLDSASVGLLVAMAIGAGAIILIVCLLLLLAAAA